MINNLFTTREVNILTTILGASIVIGYLMLEHINMFSVISTSLCYIGASCLAYVKH